MDSAQGFGRLGFFNSCFLQKSAYLLSVDSVAVAEQRGGLLSKGHHFPQLLDHPGHRRMSRYTKVHYLAARMIENHQYLQPLKAKGRYSEEVHRPGDWHVVAQEGQPALGLSGSSFGPDYVFPDGVRAGWIETEP
jgi:hypothetical protein